jgi:hypothetical protein
MPDIGQQQQSISESVAGIPQNASGQPSQGEPAKSSSGKPFEISQPQGVAAGYSAYGEAGQGGAQYMDTSGRGYFYTPGNVGAPGGGMMTDLSKPMTVAEASSKGITGLVGTIDQQSPIGQVPGVTQPAPTLAQGVVAPLAASPNEAPTGQSQIGGTGSETPPVTDQAAQTAAQTAPGATSTTSPQPLSSVSQLWAPDATQEQQVVAGVYQPPPGWNQVSVAGASYIVGPDNVTTYSFNPQTGYITPFSGYVNGKLVRDYITQASQASTPTPAQTAPTAPTPGTATTAPPATQPPAPVQVPEPTQTPTPTPTPAPTITAGVPPATGGFWQQSGEGSTWIEGPYSAPGEGQNVSPGGTGDGGVGAGDGGGGGTGDGGGGGAGAGGGGGAY